MKFFRSSTGPYDLPVAMSGVKMGDQLLQLGCGNGKLFAALASKVGLTGHALGIDAKHTACERTKVAAEKAGVFPFICQLHPPHVGGQILILDN